MTIIRVIASSVCRYHHHCRYDCHCDIITTIVCGSHWHMRFFKFARLQSAAGARVKLH